MSDRPFIERQRNMSFHEDRVPDLFAAWRTADLNARAAEDAVLSASLQALDGRGQPPLLADREHARRLRAEADSLLQVALDDMKKGRRSQSATSDDRTPGKG